MEKERLAVGEKLQYMYMVMTEHGQAVRSRQLWWLQQETSDFENRRRDDGLIATPQPNVGGGVGERLSKPVPFPSRSSCMFGPAQIPDQNFPTISRNYVLICVTLLGTRG